MAENSIQIPSVKTQFDEIIRNADQFRAPNPEELEAHKKSRPFIILTCPAEKVNPQNREEKILDEDTNPLILKSEYNWAFRYFSGKNDDPVRAEATMSNLLQYDENAEPSPTPESQSSLTAIEILCLCTNFGWEEVHIEDGSERCKFTIWATCKLLNIPCFGFEPTDYDQTTRIKNASDHIESVLIVYGLSPTAEATATPTLSGSRSDTPSEDNEG